MGYRIGDASFLYVSVFVNFLCLQWTLITFRIKKNSYFNLPKGGLPICSSWELDNGQELCLLANVAASFYFSRELSAIKPRHLLFSFSSTLESRLFAFPSPYVASSFE